MRGRTRSAAMRGRALAPGGAAAWSPAALPGLLAWYTAGPQWCWEDEARTVPAGDGSVVKGVTDRSGNGYHLSQSTTAYCPILYAVGGGLYVLTFDGVDDGMGGGPTLSGGSLIAFRGAQRYPGDGFCRILNASSNSLVAFRRMDNLQAYVAGTVSSGTDVTDEDPHTALLQKAAAGNWAYRIDGVDRTTGAVTNEWGTVSLASSGASFETFDGDLADVVVASAPATGDDLSSLETYLDSRLTA